MTLYKYLIRNGRWLCCLFVFVASCRSDTPITKIKSDPVNAIDSIGLKQRAQNSVADAKRLIKHGDMIVRTGNDFTSESLRQFSASDKTYSHCGIASIENDTIFVYHALGGEWNPDEKLRKDRLELFCNPEENRGFGVFTFNLSPDQTHKLDSIVRSWFDKGVMFDMKFDLGTDDRLYCAEFVGKAFHKASEGNIQFLPTLINKFEFLAVDNLFLEKHCVEKLRVKFQ